MNAADVLAHALVPKMSDLATGKLVAALLAHGEQGVAILPDGTLARLVWARTEWINGEQRELFALSAEAGDTLRDQAKEAMAIAREMLNDSAPVSAEAGDTDA